MQELVALVCPEKRLKVCYNCSHVLPMGFPKRFMNLTLLKPAFWQGRHHSIAFIALKQDLHCHRIPISTRSMSARSECSDLQLTPYGFIKYQEWWPGHSEHCTWYPCWNGDETERTNHAYESCMWAWTYPTIAVIGKAQPTCWLLCPLLWVME